MQQTFLAPGRRAFWARQRASIAHVAALLQSVVLHAFARKETVLAHLLQQLRHGCAVHGVHSELAVDPGLDLVGLLGAGEIRQVTLECRSKLLLVSFV